MLKHTIALILVLATALGTMAQEAATATPAPVVSLITFYPGDEIFEVFGHTEIKVTDDTNSYYINYGVFDFNSPGFLMRYVMGETDYFCAMMPPQHDGGIKPGRKMVEQELALTPAQAQEVCNLLAENLLPENREYRYRHFSDNCATRPRDVMEQALGMALGSDACRSSMAGTTLRRVMHHYTAHYAWETLGIDLAMGAACDTLISPRTHTFVPMFLMDAVAATRVDGHPLVAKTSTINAGSDSGIVLPPTPWYLHPLTMAVLLLVVALWLSWRDMRRGKLCRAFDAVFFAVAALAGCIVWFVALVSTHEAVSPNYNILWLSPFLLILAFTRCDGRAAKFFMWCHMLNIAALATVATVWLSGLQEPNAAFLPLVAVSLLRSATAILLTRRSKKKQQN